MNRDVDLKSLSWSQANKKKTRRTKSSRGQLKRKHSLDWNHMDRLDLEEGALDPRVIRFIVGLSLWGVALLLTVVHFQVKAVNLSYRSRELTQNLKEMSEANKELQAEIAGLEAPERLDCRAKRLGLVDVDPQEVCYVRGDVPVVIQSEPGEPETKGNDGSLVPGTLKRVASQIVYISNHEEGAG